ncbi:TIR domain-containing protein [Lentzea sp. NBRC 105346]|uniref:tetratricopeptide repeat protein n=1 Tax=Lentzea sp. NBRC 105346 TaxID=3032205 RepID=UPI0025558364|nr:TIR domain-containing protein [Lentzea sp. NBRC 105346]
MGPHYDVFLSFSGDDRQRVAELAGALRRAGVRPFVDDWEIRYAHDITGEIEAALRGSKTMLTYYSTSFPTRPACQFELHHAYLSALRAGEVERRILVINPEDPRTEHLMPLETGAHRYWKTWNTKQELAEIVSGIRDAVRQVGSPFPGIDFSARATAHHGPAEPTAGFVGRYRDRWAIHRALHRGDHPLTETVTSRPVAALSGMTGIGKTSLAKVYVHDFGFLYGGGVFWTELTGAGGSARQVSATHTAKLRRLADDIGLPLGDMSRRQLLGWWNRHLATCAGPVLWVVDDVPRGEPAEVLAELVPHAAGVYTLLIGQHEFPREFAEPVRLSGLTRDDGRELFAVHRAPAEDENEAVDDVVARLGGHPYAISFAAAGARGREGLWRLWERVEHLTTDATVLGRALATVRLAVERRVGAERVVLALSAVCAADPIPAVLIRDVIGAVDSTDRSRTNEILSTLDRDMLVEPVGTSWQVHQLVREAARQGIAADELEAIAVVAARKLIELAELGTAALAEHATALLARTGRSTELSIGLNTVAARHHDRRGEPGLAAPFHENLCGLEPDRLDHLLAAARARHAAGQYEQARDHARKLFGLACDDLMAMRAECVHGAVLDAIGHHREAEAVWARLVHDDVLATAAPEERIEVRTAYIRNRRALGYFTEARSLARDLLGEFGERYAEEVIPVRLELVAIGMASDDREGARTAAQEVVDHYRRLGLPGHINAIEAATLLYEAQLEVHILERFPDRAEWLNAEVELRKLLESAERRFGPDNPRTLTIKVAHLKVMVGLGRPEQTVREYGTLPTELAVQLSPDHRLYLRSVFLIGQAHAQKGDYPTATAQYQTALAGQESVLGPGHPETLRSRYELGVMRWLAGDRAAALAAFESVKRDAVQEVGRRNDLYGQAWTGSVLASFLPGIAVQAFGWLDRRWRTKPES